jgi:hypothetical protein
MNIKNTVGKYQTIPGTGGALGGIKTHTWDPTVMYRFWRHPWVFLIYQEIDENAETLLVLAENCSNPNAYPKH